ncbi:hypothetical protein DSO57_1021299 [Entomophthora muscae]|uniref:Uncharacterized protein n=1 Tax=Entomophthora muscae TaxID=34485 RepID=A0ACC2TQK9_9FUNG|nr:hypothetical protein DSO57_1021299 [Entomophthora muscae]
MAIVFPGVAQPKRCHPGKPSPKPRPLAAIVDLNLMIDHKWVVAREIGSRWCTDAPRPISLLWPAGQQILTSKEVRRPPHQDVPKGFKFVITRLIDSAFSPLQFPGNLPPPAEMIPETRKIECEPIYAADSLTLSQIKVFLMYLCIIFCYTFPYSLFKDYHLQVNTHGLLLIGNVILIWIILLHHGYLSGDFHNAHYFILEYFCSGFLSPVIPILCKDKVTQPRCTLLSRLKFWQPAPSLPSPLLNTAREILALTEEWTQHGFPQKLLSFSLKRAEPESREWCLSILDQAPNSFDDVSTLISLVIYQSPATSSLIDYKTLFSSSQGPQPLPLHLKQF